MHSGLERDPYLMVRKAYLTKKAKILKIAAQRAESRTPWQKDFHYFGQESKNYRV